ncbi:type II CAAX prenyl endopeptidase Rce1 family protein [Haloimpatiens sp. FM7315]|uniref:CPBP family glutamic-type intramembrane protease n=1 Tax=Haloimpatiens sp. FM7315 TaxID=3298609 RepID=UPI00370A88BD
MNKSNKKIFVFLFFIIVLISFPFYKMISAGSAKVSGKCILIVMWAPAISAFITKLVFDRDLRKLGFKIGNLKYIGISFIIPLIAALLVYSIVWITGIGQLDSSRLISELSLSKFGMIMSFIATGILALGEEIGWRGFLVPELFKKFSYTKTSIITGVIWSMYHYPILFFSDYNNGVSVLSSFVFFTISVFAVCFITTWLRLKSGSLWTGAILHASHNYFIQGIFDHSTIDKGYTKLITTEFGIGLAIAYVLIAVYFWRRRGIFN